MVGPGFLDFIVMILVIYPIAAILTAVTIGVGIALGFRWGGKWLLKAIYNDPEFENWLKQVLKPSEKPIQ